MPSILPVGPRIFVEWIKGGGDLTTSLISFWKLDEASGTRNDSVGTNHLTDNNTVTQATGKIGNAAQFTSANQESLSRASNASLQAGDIDFTIAFWVMLDSKTHIRFLYAKRDVTAGRSEYQVAYDHDSDRFAFSVFRATDSIVIVRANNLGAPSTGVWYHIVAWHDATANTISIAVNDGAVDTLATGGSLQAASDSVFHIGSWAGATTFEHNGRLDEAGWWKRILTAEERTALYNNGVGIHYPFTSEYELTSRTKSPPGVICERGKDQIRVLSPPMAGHFTCTVDNRTKDYSSEYEASPLYGLVEPGKPIWVVSDTGSGSEPIWKGVLDDISENPGGQKDVNFVAIGRLATLSGQTISVGLYENITIDEALGYLLDAAGWPSTERSIAVSAVNLIRWWVADEDAFSAMMDLLNTEGPGAAIYERADGYFVFEDRHYRETETRSLVSNFTFDGPLTLDYNPAFKDVVNECIVEVTEREVGEEEIVWELGQSFTLSANESRSFIASGGGDPFVDAVVPTTSGINAVQSLLITSDIGDYTDDGGILFTFREQATGLTPPDSGQIQIALEALSSIGSGNVSVPLTPLPFLINFQGTLGNQPIELLGVSATGGFGVILTEVSPGQLADYAVSSGSVASVTLDRTAGFSCTITVTAGASGAVVTGLRLRAKRITILTTHSIRNDYDASGSIRRYGLRSINPSIRGDISLDEGLTLANRYVEHNRNRRGTGHIEIVNDTNQGLVREISDLITIQDTQTDLDNVFWIEQIKQEFLHGSIQRTTFGVERAHADSHTDTHSDVAHSDTAHADSHSDVAHTDTAHVDSHTDSATHSDVAHTDTHSDVAHSDVAHSDVAHSDTHSDDHTDVAHSDDVHSDTHSDTAHSDTAHSDTLHTDSTVSEHGDSHSDFTDQFFDHGDDHSDDHTDTHSDVAHVDTAHSDAGHTDSHSDAAHSDTAHTDSHSDTSHTDSAHSDSAHTDTAHTDTHSDVAHSDDAHSDTHSDTAHSDAAHTDTHSDSGHSDTAHTDTHTDAHGDAS